MVLQWCNSRLLIHDGEEPKRLKKHFTAVLNHITSDEVPPLLDDIAGQGQGARFMYDIRRSIFVLTVIANDVALHRFREGC